MKSLDLFKLEKKVAVVTGGCGNLGPFWVKALLEAGGKVAIIDLPGLSSPIIDVMLNSFQHSIKIPNPPAGGRDDKKCIKKSPLKIYKADVTDPESLLEAHKLIKKDLGSVDILVNNAGIDAPPVKVDSSDCRFLDDKINSCQMWQVNVQGVVNCIEEFASDMKEKKWGSIINIGSLYLERSPDERFYNHLGFDKPWAYGATKAALHQVARHFATRLAKYGIRVNTLSPGGVFDGQEKGFVKKYCKRVPLQRMVDKEKDLAGPLIFLASDASSYVTGINLQVNGGYTAW